MEAYHDDRGRFGRRPGRNPWLLPLVIGLMLGAVVGGLAGSMWWSSGGALWGDQRASAYVSGQQEQQARSAPFTDRGMIAPGAEFHGHGRGGEFGVFSWGRHGGWWSWFAPARILVPLLLIGAGAWLLSGRRRGPGSGGGTAFPQGSDRMPPPNVGASPTGPQSPSSPQPSATDETRLL